MKHDDMAALVGECHFSSLTEQRMTVSLADSTRKEPCSNLSLRVNDRPTWKQALLFGGQQATVCLSGLLVYPFLVSGMVCAGTATIALRVHLISATFTACGIATLLQTTLGLRLSILNGPAFSFLPPLLAFADLPINACPAEMRNISVPQEIWAAKIQTISGSMIVACLFFVLVGVTGLVGAFSKMVSPITTVPLLVLLTMSALPSITEKLALHWISILMLLVVIVCIVYLEDVHVPLPGCGRIRLFGQFPYLLSIIVVWAICGILTATGLEPPEGEARVDKAEAMKVLQESPWFAVPLPGEFGFPRLDVGLMCAFVASCMSSVIENLGSYEMAARVSEQRRPPRSAVNRAIIVEGLGSMVAGIFGVCAGVTTYSENVALIHITRVASRMTMQIAGVLLICVGLFSKVAALLAAIPEALVGGILCMGMSMIAGVALSQLQLVDLKQTRNLSIMGLALMLGMAIPMHVEQHNIGTGVETLDRVLNMLLTIKMLVGGVIAFFLDNTVPGATRRQRGFLEDVVDDKNRLSSSKDDGYAFPVFVNRFLLRFPVLTRLPFLPSLKSLTPFHKHSLRPEIA